jgi:hypothetical protein
MTNLIYSAHRRAIVRRTVLVLAVAGAGYLAVALLHDKASPRNESSAFSAPARAAEFSAPPPANHAVQPNIAAPAATSDSGQSDSARIQDPRECDVAKGIETACMFMD